MQIPLLCVEDGDGDDVAVAVVVVVVEDGVDDADAEVVGVVVDCVALGEACTALGDAAVVVAGAAWRGV